MHYKTGDQPAGMVFPLPEDLFDADVTGATVRIAGVAPITQHWDDEERAVVATAPAPFTVPGYVPVDFVAQFDEGNATREVEPIIIEPAVSDGWLTLASARRAWADAPDSDEILHGLLTAAKTGLLAWLEDRAFTTAEDGTKTPIAPGESWRVAHWMQARAMWQAGRVNRDGDAMGFESEAIALFPLNRDIKHLLIPKSRIPRFR
ncbi:hypothetical protein GCM10027515_26600 [Schumannella luteola]|uniref:Uncharacterized protein n=1 Tax=Schumannella luteola TaxID=472059 RepID=A0A852YAL0_9MICO|nr:hypothetical protein [Schumannella luteola]NYG99543.1 hypothetical protein [Schumannella luteola]TPX03860.1 hypothetical protein FJ656_15120 [Schumannella luteola]